MSKGYLLLFQLCYFGPAGLYTLSLSHIPLTKVIECLSFVSNVAKHFNYQVLSAKTYSVFVLYFPSSHFRRSTNALTSKHVPQQPLVYSTSRFRYNLLRFFFSWAYDFLGNLQQSLHCIARLAIPQQRTT